MTSSSRGRAAARVAQGASIPRTPPGGPIVRSPGGPIVRVPAGPIVPSAGGGLAPWIQRIRTGTAGVARGASLLNPLTAAATVLSTAYGVGNDLYQKALQKDKKNEERVKAEDAKMRAGGFDPNASFNFRTRQYQPQNNTSSRNPTGNTASFSNSSIGTNSSLSAGSLPKREASQSQGSPPSLLRSSRVVPSVILPATAASAAIESGAATPEQVNQYQESVNAAQAFQNQSEALTKEFGSMDNVRALAEQTKAPLTFTPQEGGTAYKPSLSDYYNAQNVVGQGRFNPQNQNFNQTTFDQAMNQMGFQNREDMQTWAKANPMLAQRLLNKAGGLPATETTTPAATTTNQDPDQGSLTGIPQSGPLNPNEPFTWSTSFTSTSPYTTNSVVSETPNLLNLNTLQDSQSGFSNTQPNVFTLTPNLIANPLAATNQSLETQNTENNVQEFDIKKWMGSLESGKNLIQN